jgi:hypothetical protein
VVYGILEYINDPYRIIYPTEFIPFVQFGGGDSLKVLRPQQLRLIPMAKERGFVTGEFERV